MFKEYDVVRARYNLSTNVPKYSKGVVLIIFEKPSIAYEVEFVDDLGNTIDLLTVKQEDIEKDIGTLLEP